MRFCLAGSMIPRVRMLCTRSASFTSSTRISWDMERIILRIYSACWVCRSPKTSCPSLVTPLTTSATSSPKYSSKSSREAAESSTVSWSKPEETVDGPQAHLGQMIGDFQGVGQIRLAAQAQLAFMGLG